MLVMTIHKKSTKIWLSAFAFLIIFALAFYFVIIRGSTSTVTTRILIEEKIVAKANASNIESFFQMVGDFLAARAQMDNIVYPDYTTTHDLKVFLGQWKESGLINGIILTDDRGVVAYNSNVSGTSVVGNSVANSDYFKWGKEKARQGDYFVGAPMTGVFGPSKGKTIIPVTAAVFKDGHFSGVLTTAVQLSVLTEQYLGLLKVSDGIYLFDANGTVLYSSESVVPTGSNVVDYLSANSYLDDFLSKDKVRNLLNINKSGSLRWPVPGGKGSLAFRLVAYSPINIGELHWLLVLSNPEQRVSKITMPIYIRQTTFVLLFSLAFVVFGLFSSGRIGFKK